MITSDLDYYQPGSNSSILGLTTVGAANTNPQVTAQSDRVVMLRSLYLSLASDPDQFTAPINLAVINNLFVQSWDCAWSQTVIAAQGNGFPMTAFQQGSGIAEMCQVMAALWVQQTLDIRTTVTTIAGVAAADLIFGAVGVDDLENNAKWRALTDSLRRSNVPPGRINWLFGLGTVALPGIPAQVGVVPGQTVFQASAARPGIGPGMLVVQAPPHSPGDLLISDISISNVSQLPSLARAVNFDACMPTSFQRRGITIAKPLDLATPVSVTIQNTTGAPIPAVSVGFISPAAFAIGELNKAYQCLPGSERRQLESIGASPVQLLGAATAGRVIG